MALKDELIKATEAGKLNWYADNAARGKDGEVELDYLCSFNGYEIDLSTVSATAAVKQDGFEVGTVDDKDGLLVKAVETFVAAKEPVVPAIEEKTAPSVAEKAAALVAVEVKAKELADGK